MIYNINPYRYAVVGTLHTYPLSRVFTLTQDTEVSFSGSEELVGSFTLTLETETSLNNLEVTASFAFTQDTETSFIGDEDAVTSFALTLDTETSFKGIVDISIGRLDSTDSVVVCANVRNFGISEYTNYNFSGFFKLGDKYYGCSTSGIYDLSGRVDGTDPIHPSIIKTAASDYGTQQLKSVRDCYAYIRSTGDTLVRVITNEQRSRGGYQLHYDEVDGIHRRRVKVAQGIKGTTWQVEMTIDDGSEATIKQIDVHPIELDRSI